MINCDYLQAIHKEEDDRSTCDQLSPGDSYSGLMEDDFYPPVRKSQQHFTPPSHPPMRKAYSDPMSSKSQLHQSDQIPSYSDMYSSNSQFQAYSLYQPTPPPPPPAITLFTYSRSPTPMSDSSSYYSGYGRGFDVSPLLLCS